MLKYDSKKKCKLFLYISNFVAVLISIVLFLIHLDYIATIFWFAYSSLYSIITYLLLNSKSPIKIKFRSLLIMVVICSIALFIISLWYNNDLYIDYFHASIILFIVFAFVFVAIDWCLSNIILLITKQIIDKKNA